MLSTEQIVLSLSGHDKDRLFVITKVEDGFCWVANGKDRPLNHPKRKNPRHLRATGRTMALAGLTDRQLRRNLQKTVAQEEKPD